MWHTVCADILQKRGWIFSLYCGWIRHETKSSETSCPVTIQRVNHSRKLGNKMHFQPALPANALAIFFFMNFCLC